MDREELIGRVGELQDEFARSSMRAQSKEMLDQHLTLAQFRALVLLHGQEGLTMSEVADVLAMRPNIATGVVQRLEDRGWVERTRDADDGRVRRVGLTADGIATVDGIVTEARSDFLDLASALTDEQLGQMASILETLIVARAAQGRGAAGTGGAAGAEPAADTDPA
ncbi:MarR family winged helix-turn-helix transcriptional regulator [Demequina sp. NBRC 110056]|uniref:MarR family winged helix-turn-helix transcriptional regulator n=1 Tax=Demequina sp. NBRC 110056 TaxID=1570345 RepID=UPI0013564392|nr:MarR family transcriptional regulator [Demequina sp. NBRC 110056]